MAEKIYTAEVNYFIYRGYAIKHFKHLVGEPNKWKIFVIPDKNVFVEMASFKTYELCTKHIDAYLDYKEQEEKGGGLILPPGLLPFKGS